MLIRGDKDDTFRDNIKDTVLDIEGISEAQNNRAHGYNTNQPLQSYIYQANNLSDDFLFGDQIQLQDDQL